MEHQGYTIMETTETKMNRFSCDRQAKYDFVSSITFYVSGVQMDFYEMDAKNELVPFGSSAASPTAPFDVVILTPHNRYVVELKDRWKYDSTIDPAYLEPHKYRNLLLAKEGGFIPLYGMLYKDGIINIWKVKEGYESGTTCAKKYTVLDGPKEIKTEYLLWDSGATSIPRITAIL